MNAQLDETGGAVLRRAIENLGIEVLMGKRTTSIHSDAEHNVTGIGFADGTAVDCDMLVLSTGIRPNVGLAQAAGPTVERAIVADDHMRSIDDDDIYVVGGACSTAVRCMGWWPRCGNRPRCWPTTSPAPTSGSAYRGSRTSTKLKVAGSTSPRWVSSTPEHGTTSTSSSASWRGVYKTAVVQDNRLIGATPGRRRQQGVVPDAGLRSGHTAARQAGGTDVRHRHARRRDQVAELSDDAQVCNCNGVAKRRSWTASTGGTTSVGGVASRHPRRQRLQLVQRDLVGQLVAWSGRRRHQRNQRALVRASDPAREARTDAPDPGVEAALGTIGVRRTGTRRQEDANSRWASSLLDDVGSGFSSRKRARAGSSTTGYANIQRDGTFGGPADEG